jgi:two-component system response regulator AlgR
MQIAIVDDEPLARARLRSLVHELLPGVVAIEAGTGLAALELLENTAVDVVLLDIQMPGMDGLEVARHLAQLPAPPAVIFTTAFDVHALAAFDAQAIDYLLKPVRLERLQAALARAAQWTAARASQSVPSNTRSHHTALVAGSLRLVPLADVQYFEADGGYVRVCHRGGELLVEDSLRALEEEFGERFLRIHRHTLVAVALITELVRDRLGNYEVRLRDVATSLPVSRRLVSEVKRRLR